MESQLSNSDLYNQCLTLGVLSLNSVLQLLSPGLFLTPPTKFHPMDVKSCYLHMGNNSWSVCIVHSFLLIYLLVIHSKNWCISQPCADLLQWQNTWEHHSKETSFRTSGEMAWYVKALVVKSDHWCLIPGTYPVGGENWLMQAVYWPPHAHGGTHVTTYMCAHTNAWMNEFFKKGTLYLAYSVRGFSPVWLNLLL